MMHKELAILMILFSCILPFHSQGVYIQKITDIHSETINQTSVLITWSLKKPPKNDSNETFHIYLATNSQFKYLGSTQQFSYLLTDLVHNQVYSYKIGLTHSYTNSTYYSDVQYFIIGRNVAENSNEMEKLKISGIVIIVVISFSFLMGCVIVFSIITVRRKNRNKEKGKNPSYTTPDNPNLAVLSDLRNLNPSDCENANIFINEASFQDISAICNIDTVEGINLEVENTEPDSIYFANISNIEDVEKRAAESEKSFEILLEPNECTATSTLEIVQKVNEECFEVSIEPNEFYAIITIKNIEVEEKATNLEDCDISIETNEFDAISSLLDLEDEQVVDGSVQIEGNSTNDTYVIEQTESQQDLNQTYEILQKEYVSEEENIEKEFIELNTKTNHGLTDENELNQIFLESPHFESFPVNASYIKDKQFVATVHPSRKRNLLQLVYQTACNMVIMLTTKSEYQAIITRTSEHVRYWPLKDAPTTDITIPKEQDTLIDQEISLQHSLENDSISFRHLISSGWNEDGTFCDIKSVLTLLQIMIKHKQNNPNSPIIIHCSDGLRKTGVLLTSYIAIEELRETKSFNIPNIVKELRIQRANMVPNLISYRNCYSLTEEYTGFQQ